MKILVSTKETQGKRKNDFSWCNEGEMVTFSMDCDGETVDGKCGCRRSMIGIITHKATTTMKVVEVDIHPLAYMLSIKEGLKESYGKLFDDKEINKIAREDMKALLSLSNAFTTGRIVERRGRNYQTRS